MNIQEMLSKMNPEMLVQGLNQISRGLTSEQLKQAENVIKGQNLPGDIKNASNIIGQLQKNPEILKQLASNPEVVAKLQSIVKKK